MLSWLSFEVEHRECASEGGLFAVLMITLTAVSSLQQMFGHAGSTCNKSR